MLKTRLWALKLKSFSPLQNLTYYFSKICSNVILPPLPKTPKRSLRFKLTGRNFASIPVSTPVTENTHDACKQHLHVVGLLTSCAILFTTITDFQLLISLHSFLKYKHSVSLSVLTCFSLDFSIRYYTTRKSGHALVQFGRSTALQAGRSRVRFPIMSLEFSGL
jgi:hypothetical protein